MTGWSRKSEGQARLPAAVGWSAGVAAVVFLLASASLATASTSTGPWKGSQSTSGASINSGGCGTAKETTPTWSAKTGHFAWSGSANARSCGGNTTGLTGGDMGSASAGGEIFVPLKVLSSGKHTIVVNATFSAVVSLTYSGGICKLSSPSSTGGWCNRGAGAGLVAYAYIIDATNGTYLYTASNSPSVGSQISNYSDYYAGAWHDTTTNLGNSARLSIVQHWWWNATGMVRFHRFVLEIVWEANAGVSASSAGATLKGFTGSANLNFSTHGNGGTLTSVYIS